MADPNDHLLISDVEFARIYLGIGPADVGRLSRVYDDSGWKQFWQTMANSIQTQEELNLTGDETEEEKKFKIKLKQRAEDLMNFLRRISSDTRDVRIDLTKFQEDIQEWVGELDQAEKRLYTNETTRVGHVFMGPKNLDPTDIRIQEVHTIQRVQTVRSDNEVAIKTPKSITQITMDLVFTGASDINGRLRDLLGSLIASPLTTIENPFMTAALINHFSTPELVEAIRSRIINSDDLQDTADLMRDANAESEGNFDRLQELLELGDLTQEWYRQLLLEPGRRTGAIGTALNSEQNENPEPLPNMGVSIPVAFQNCVISTDPDAVDTLHVRLTFLRLNPNAFGAYGLEYRDVNGNRTPDIAKCPWIGRYVEWAYLSPDSRGDPDLGKNPFYLEDYKAHLTDDADFTCRWHDMLDGTIFRHFPGPKSGEFVVNSVQVAFGMKLAILPIVGAKYPAIQVMGRGTAEGRVILQTTSLDTVRELTLMKDHLDAISRNVAGQFRDEMIHIENSVLNLTGARKFLIRSSEIGPIPRTTDAYQIDLNLIQSRYTYNEQQALLLRDQTIPEIAYRDFWNYLWEKYQAAREKMTVSISGFEAMDPVDTAVFQLLFGRGPLTGFNPGHGGYRGPTGRGIITPDIFVAALFKMAAKEIQTAEQRLEERESGSETGTIGRGAGTYYGDPDLVDDVYNWFGIGAGSKDVFTPTYTTTVNGKKREIRRSIPNVVTKAFTFHFPQEVEHKGDGTIDLPGRFGNNSYGYPISDGPRIIEELGRWMRPFLERAVATQGAKDAGGSTAFGTAGGVWENIIGVLSIDRYRRFASFSKDLWDAIYEVIMEPQAGPHLLPNANNVFREQAEKAWNKKKSIWKRDELVKGQMNFTYLLNTESIEAFQDFDWEKYIPGETTTNGLVATTEGISPEVAKRLSSNFPDMPMPSYDQFFNQFAGMKGEKPESSDRMVHDPVRKKDLQLWKRFAPTYSDLGIEPPYERRADPEGAFLLARGKNSIMEPGFWFYHQKVKSGMIKRAKRALETSGQRPEDVQNPEFTLKVEIGTERQIRDLVARGNSRASARETLAQKIEMLIRADQRPETLDLLKKAEQKNITIDLIDNTNMAVARFRLADRAGGNRDWHVDVLTGGRAYVTNVADHPQMKFDRRSPEHNRQLTAKIIEGLPDNVYSMSRSYPALRVYFVEWDDNVGRFKRERAGLGGRRVRMLDDLYTSNAIISVNITHSKDDASVAVVSVLNTIGTFDTDSFLLKEEADNVGIRGPDDEGEDFLRRMRLQTGTGIVIQMGYSADINGLHTVFTGQIAEIQPGKVVTFVAQGYKTELDREVDIHQNDEEGPRAAIQKLLEMGQNGGENLTPHLGRIMDRRGLHSAEVVQSLGAQMSEDTGVLGMQGPNGALAQIFGGSINSISRNVWVESALGTQNFFGQAWQNLLETLGGADKEWRFNNITAWQGLQEMSRHWSGTICAVRPFGAEATVFFGYPDQPYLSDQVKLRDMKAFMRRAVPKRIAATAGLMSEVMNKFWRSKFGTTDTTLQGKQVAEMTRAHEGSKLGRDIGGQGFDFFWWEDDYLGSGRVGEIVSKDGVTSPSVLDMLFGSEGGSYTAWMDWASKQASYDEDITTIFDDVDGDAWEKSFGQGMLNIPLYNTMKLDFSGDWATINSFNSTLGKFIFAHFFNLRYDGSQIWGGSVESRWRNAVEMGMRPLIRPDGNGTSVWESWIRMTGVFDPDGSTNYYEDGGGEFDERYDSVANKTGDIYVQITAALRALQESLDDKKITAQEYKEMTDELRRLETALKEQGGVIDPLQVPAEAVGRRIRDVLKDLEIAEGVKFGVSAQADRFGTLGRVLFNHMPYFRLFVHYFAGWIRWSQQNPDADYTFRAADTMDLIGKLSTLDLPPGFKPFRQYHTVFSDHDIIDNSIVASMSEMYNSVIIRCPEDAIPDEFTIDDQGRKSWSEGEDWISWPQMPGGQGMPYHPNIKKSHRKLAVAVEPNATTDERRAQVLLSNMSQALRPMYRGSIKFVGKNVWPWDSVLISDQYNAIYGVIEADRVTHEFNGQNGWVTTVEPHAYCHVNNPWGMYHLTNYSDYAGILDTAMDVIFWASIVLAVFTAGTSLIGAGVVAGRTAAAATTEAVLAGAVSTGTRATTKAIILRKAMTESAEKLANEAFRRGLLETAKTAGAASFRGALGRHLGENWLGACAHVGRNWFWAATLTDGGPEVVRLLYNLTSKARINNAFFPIDFRPVTSKGNPLTAGLNLHDADLMTYADKAKGTFEKVRKQIGDWLAGNDNENKMRPDVMVTPPGSG